MKWLALLAVIASTSQASSADDVLRRNMDVVLDLVAMTVAVCAQNYEAGLSAKAVAALNFSAAEQAAYCACASKRLIQEMTEADFQTFDATKELPVKFEGPMKDARFKCAKDIWEFRKKTK